MHAFREFKSGKGYVCAEIKSEVFFVRIGVAVKCVVLFDRTCICCRNYAVNYNADIVVAAALRFGCLSDRRAVCSNIIAFHSRYACYAECGYNDSGKKNRYFFHDYNPLSIDFNFRLFQDSLCRGELEALSRACRGRRTLRMKHRPAWGGICRRSASREPESLP